MEQTGLDSFSGGGERPTGEAAAVAGNGGVHADVIDVDEQGFSAVDDVVDISVTQVNYTIEGQGDEEYPVLHVFGRTADDEAEHVRVYHFRPYFYTPLDGLDHREPEDGPVCQQHVTDRRIIDEERLTGVETYGDLPKDEAGDHGDDELVLHESIRGDPLVKVFGQTPRDVGQLREEFDHYEADILFPNRLLIDKDITSGVRVPARRLDDDSLKVHHREVRPVDLTAEPRINTFDIEVDDRSGFPEEGEEPIVCLTSHDSFQDEYVVWLNEAPDSEGPDDLDGYDPIEGDLEVTVRRFDNEEAMLEAYIDYIGETDPDIITGWNCLPADSRISMADGTETEIQHIDVGDEVVGSDDGRTTVAEVTNKWKSEKQIHEFILADGTTLRSSGDHQIMVGDDGNVGWKQGREVESGDYVVKPRTLRVENEAVPQLAELVPTENQRCASQKEIKKFKQELPRGAIGELAGESGLAAGTLYHPETDIVTPKRYATAAAEYDPAVPDGGRKYRRTGIDLDRKLTEHELYLAGLILTDGSMSRDDGIRFYNTRKELHRQFPGDGKLQPDGKGRYSQNVLDYARMYAFNGLGIPFGDKNAVDVDLSTVYQMPRPYIAEFLAGVIDGEGSVSPGSITVSAENRAIGQWYAKLFKRLGIYAYQRETSVCVPDAECDVDRLKEHVLPHMSHPEKVQRLTEFQGGKSGQTENVPFALFEAEVGSEGRRIGNDKRRRGLNLKRRETLSEEWKEYVFVEVEDTTIGETETTYDIETTTHNFFADGCLVHNCDDFDAPYLIDRLERLNQNTDRDLDYHRLSRVNEVWRSDWQGPNVKGRVVFDLLYAYKRTQFTELESYRLDAVGETELGVGKERYTGDIGDLWEEEPRRLLEYNLRDVELCVELDRKQDIIPFWEEVASFVGCKLEDATTPGDAVDMYILHKVHGEFALPSKGTVEAEDYEGGAVFDPITGVRENVTVLDLKCFSRDTDVLTPEGARNIADLEVGDAIYTLNPETFECEIKPVTETHEYPNHFGELHHLSGNTHDLKVTENHRFLLSKERGRDDQVPDAFEFVEYRDVPDSERFAFPQHEPMAGRTPSTFELVDEVEEGYAVVYSDDDPRMFRNRMPGSVMAERELIHGSSQAMGLQQKVGKYLIPLAVYREHRSTIDELADDVFLKYGRQHRETPMSFEMDDWLAFLAWFVTEGSIDEQTGRVTLHQSDPNGRAAIQSLLDRMGINYNSDDRGINVSDRYLLDWLGEHCGEGHKNKRLPEWVFDLDADLLETLLNTVIRGDRRRADSGLGKFRTKSDHLRQAITDIAVRCGYKPTVSKQSDGTWYVSIGKRGSFEKGTNATVEDHDGNVYCITAADNHVVLAGRNGHYQWVGQSLYPMCMVTTNASPETKVDPETYDGETYRAPNGTHFRKEPDGIIREMVDELLDEREQKKAARDEHEPDSDPYEQFDRQQSAVKVIMNCFSADTDVLTPDGIRNIRELDVGDRVYSLNPETMQMEVKPVVETHAYPEYRGEMVDIETSNIDFSVTPNHRMLIQKNDKNGITEDGWNFVEAGEMQDHCHYEMPHDWSFEHGDGLKEVDLLRLAESNLDLAVVTSEDDAFLAADGGVPGIQRYVGGNDFVRLIGRFATEERMHCSDGRSTQSAKIAPENSEGRAKLDTLPDSAIRTSSKSDRDFRIPGRVLRELFERLCGQGSENKRLPDEILQELSERQKWILLETLVDGDGDWNPSSSSFSCSTKSDQLRDDVMELCLHLGLTPKYRLKNETWQIQIDTGSKNSFRMYRDGSRSTAEDGAYCVTVADNHTLVAGRNGKFQNVSQSLYGVLGWDRFRLYDKEMGAAVTATGREVIEFTEEAAAELDKEVIYGDSVTGDRPIVVRDPEGIVRIEPIAELFALGTPDDEVLLTADGGPVGSTSVGKDRRSLDGWDALSLSPGQEAEWQPVQQVVRHETDEAVVKLQHKFGESKTTRDHSYVVDEGEELIEASPDDVSEPLRVPGLPEVDTTRTVDVFEVLQGYTREYEDGRSVGKSAARTKTKRIHTDGEYVWFGHEHHGNLESTVKLQRHVDITSSKGHALIRLLAAYVSEGSASTVETTDSRFGASIAESRQEWLEGLQEDYQSLFENTTASIVESDTADERTVEYETASGDSNATYDDRTRKLQMMNELAAVFFREFAGQTSRGKLIPSFVFHLPETEQDLFLDVLIEGDGSREFLRYSDEYADRNFDFETTSRRLAGGLSTLLTQRGKKHSLKYRDAKDSYTIRTCEYYRRGREPVLTEVEHDGYVYDLSVAENQNFVDGVGGIVLHNTDSVMLELGHDVTKGEAIEQSFEIEEHINGRYDEFALEELNAHHHRFQIEFEKLYRRFFQAGKKKRYAGHIVWKEGKDVDDIDITGFEYKRSDIAPITKEVQREVIERIVTGEPLDEVKTYVHEIVERFQEGDVSLDEIGIPGGIGKRLDNYDTDTAHVRGAKYANLMLGTNFQRGAKPKRVYLDRVHDDFFRRVEAEQGLDPSEDPLYGEFKGEQDVICFEYADQVPEEFEIDWEKMLDRTLRGPIERILEALDISWEEVKSGQEQTGLGSFM